MANPTRSVTLTVLAGGAGARMGGRKSDMRIDDEPVLCRLLRRLRWEGPTLLVIAPNVGRPPGADLFDVVVHDRVAHAGPLQGVSSALLNVRTAWTAVVPVDMPALTADVLEELIRFHDSKNSDRATMCVTRSFGGEKIEPFPCVVPAALGPVISKLLESGRRSLVGLLNENLADLFSADHWPSETWINLNTPDDLAGYQAKP